MGKKYALELTGRTLDLAEILNNGIRPKEGTDDEPEYLVFEIKDKTVQNPTVMDEDALYDEHGVGDPKTIWLLN
jgi:hypothetical protein